ncbi:MAG: cobalamin biosynthesis protein [Actinomycetales bacterium]|nr:MAG: cobalamin biosynthesis protein [Actinomycetales bacterium]
MNWSAATGIALGFIADQLLGDPVRGHPVAIFGNGAAKLEKLTYADSKAAGVYHEVILVGGAVAVGILANYPKNNLIRVFNTAAATFFVLGGTTLGSEAEAVSEKLASQDLIAARKQVARIVGRNTTELDETEIARAAVETVAENTSDAVVAPLFWGTICGIPGLIGYRAINTMDAMVGYPNSRYRNFGWAAAKLDDLANWLPARLTAGLTVLAHRKKASQIWKIIRRDASKHPSPNAGQVESAFAGALDLQLGGANNYGGEVEERGHLGDGHSPTAVDISRAVQLSKQLGVMSVALAITGSLLRR